ncbi:hypothetical protein MATL_G00221170 [Megalops atlanticus]|uniref:Coiled-coil domain-containing protein 39 n=1 Tax=Megalops atlanticus TaxID=7932 RepID=A0A9D3SW93_MEGAT|nr:hypothetical protein MATL_G00221170 [Megalops atlanticus]
MEVLANAAVAEICQVVDDGYAVLRLEVSQYQKENKSLKRKIQMMERQSARRCAERAGERTGALSSSAGDGAQACRKLRGTTGEDRRFTTGESVLGKRLDISLKRDEQPVVLDSETQEQYAVKRAEVCLRTLGADIVYADTGDTRPETLVIKEERLKVTSGPQRELKIRDERAVELGFAGDKEGNPVNTENKAAQHTEELTEQHRTRHSAWEVGGLENVLKAEPDKDSVKTLLHGGSDYRAGRLSSLDSESVMYERPGQLGTYFAQGSANTETEDPSCSYATQMDTESLSVHSELQSAPAAEEGVGSSLSPFGSFDWKPEIVVVDSVAIKLEGEIASIMEVLANAAVAEICKLVEDGYAVLRLEISQSQKEKEALRRKLQMLELRAARGCADSARTPAGSAERARRGRVLHRLPGTAKAGLASQPTGESIFEKHMDIDHISDGVPAAGHEEDSKVSQNSCADMEEGRTESLLIKEERLEEDSDPQGELKIREERVEELGAEDDRRTAVVSKQTPSTNGREELADQQRIQQCVLEPADLEERKPDSVLIKEERLKDDRASSDPQEGLRTYGEGAVESRAGGGERTPIQDTQNKAAQHTEEPSAWEVSGMKAVFVREVKKRSVNPRERREERRAGGLTDLHPERAVYERPGQLRAYFARESTDAETEDLPRWYAAEMDSESLLVHPDLKSVPAAEEGAGNSGSTSGSLAWQPEIVMIDSVPIKVEAEIQKKQCLKEKLENRISEHKERIHAIADYMKLVKQRVSDTQAETEAIAHDTAVARREIGVLQQRTLQLEKQLGTLGEKRQAKEDTILRMDQKLTKEEKQMMLDQQTLKITQDLVKTREEDVMAILKYTKEDDRKIKDLILRIERKTVEASQKHKALAEECDRTATSEFEMDRTADLFRQADRQNQRLVQQCSANIQRMQERDCEMEEMLKALARVKEEVRKKHEEAKNKMNVLERKVKANQKAERSIIDEDHWTSRLRMDLQRVEGDRVCLQDETDSLKVSVDQAERDIEAERFQLVSLENDVKDKNSRARRARLHSAALQEKLQSVTEAAASREERATETERELKEEGQTEKEMESQCAQLREALSVKAQELQDLKSRENSLLTNISARQAAVTSLIKRRSDAEEDHHRHLQLLYDQASETGIYLHLTLVVHCSG